MKKKSVKKRGVTTSMVNQRIDDHEKLCRIMQKFGRTMADNNRPLNEWVKEAQEESLDFIHYLEKLLK